MQPLRFTQDVSLGCDPEFFFKDDKGNTTGSEKILPPTGIKTDQATMDECQRKGMRCMNIGSQIVVDGVQAEINPKEATCRAVMGYEISNCFRDLSRALKGRNVKVDVAPVVEVSQAEMDTLSDASKVFGCAPSTNVYTQGTSKIKVDPRKYTKRSAGGHLHLGDYDYRSDYTPAQWSRTFKALKNVDVMVPMLDIIVGNTCVLLDRDPSNKERRKNYGRAGEFRLKSYGIEYRTLSNFWLRSYPLMGLVMGLARFAVNAVAQSTPENDYAKAFMSLVNRDDIVKAIQTNNFALAYSNFLKIEKLIVELAGTYTNNYPLHSENIKEFHYFLKKGIYHWFKQDPFDHWSNLSDRAIGWERFLTEVVRTAMIRDSDTATKIENTLASIRTNGMVINRTLLKELITLETLRGKVEKTAPEVVATVAPATAPVAIPA